MRHEPSGSCPPVQQVRSKSYPACQQAKPLADFAATSPGPSSCRVCQRVVSRLASRRRAAAIRLLIAAHPEEWAGLLGLVRGRAQVRQRYEAGYRALLAELQGGGGNAV